MSMSSPNMNMRPYIGLESGSQLVPEPSRLMGSARSIDECISICIFSCSCLCPGRLRSIASTFDVERWTLDVRRSPCFSGTSFIPHFGQLPGWSETTSGCIGQVYFCCFPFAFSCSLACDDSMSCSPYGCCAITVLFVTSATVLAIMTAMCFRISSGCRAGARLPKGETWQPERLPYKQNAIATVLREKRRSVSEKALLQDQFSE